MRASRFVLVVGIIAGLLYMGASVALGSGFALYEGSARGNALGGALTARDPDPSAIYYNPAAITDLEGANLEVGATVIRPTVTVETLTPSGAVSTESERNHWIPPHAYGVYQFNDRVWGGFGVYSRFGLGSEFDSDWPGRFNNYKANIRTLTFNPNVALKLDDRFSLAAGVSAMWFDLDLRRKLSILGSELDFKMTGDSWGYGYNVGARYKLSDRVALGVAYQSTVMQEVEGDVDIGLGNSSASGDIKLPDMLFMGIAVKPVDKVSVEVGAVYTRWSTYDELLVNIDDPTLLGRTKLRSVKKWDNVWRYQAGVEYELINDLTLRAGYIYDQTPDPDATADYLVPANDRHLGSIGMGYNWRSWQFDVSYTYLYIMDRDVRARPLEGVYDSKFKDGHSHLVGVSVSKAL